jgi:hypothetical protein
MHKNKNPTKISDSFIMFSLLSGVASYKSWRDRRASWHPSSHRPAWAHASPVPANPVPKASMLRPAMLGITPSLDENGLVFLGNLNQKPLRFSGCEAFRFQFSQENQSIDGWLNMWIRKSHGRWGSPVGLDTTNFMKQDLQQA